MATRSANPVLHADAGEPASCRSHAVGAAGGRGGALSRRSCKRGYLLALSIIAPGRPAGELAPPVKARHQCAMATDHLVPEDIRALYHVREWRNAAGVLMTACPGEWADLLSILRDFRLYRSQILTAGGGLSPISQQVNAAFGARGWREQKFETKIVVGETVYASPTHAVDCFKGRVAVELEWNNKDPFFDRDLNNFRLLFDLRAIDVGVILTRATELQEVFQDLGKGSSYGPSTTHHEKLWPRIEGGGGGGCPVLTFAITPALYVDDGEEGLRAARRWRGRPDDGQVPLDLGADED
jgi:hypothetical protein